jgi:Methyltransferase domain
VSGRFEDALAAVSGVEGWLTDAQARRLWEAASALTPPATAVEIGSYRGRSAIVLARAAAGGVDVVAIDPHAGNDRGPRQLEGSPQDGEADHRAFRANLDRAGVADRVRHVRLPSAAAHEAVAGSVELLYVDGAHRYGAARDDLLGWGARVAPKGTLLVHDAFSSVGTTLALLRVAVPSRELLYLGRDGSLARYRREPLRGRARLVNASRQLAQLPWFARNVLVKTAIVLGLRRLARALGHRSGPWPH